MRKLIINDIANDIAIIQTHYGFHCRYGVQSFPCQSLADALDNFNMCLRHALEGEGLLTKD